VSASRVQLSAWLGAQLPESRLPLADHLDVVLETLAAQPLFRNVIAGRFVRPNSSSPFQYEVDFRFETSARPTPPLQDSNAPTQVATPATPLPAGRYQFSVPNLGVVSLDLYPSGAVRAGAGGAAGIPLRFSSSSSNKSFAGPLGVANYSIRFFPGGEVRVFQNGEGNQVLTKVLTFLDRVQ
jgi:hypothetical protein